MKLIVKGLITPGRPKTMIFCGLSLEAKEQHGPTAN